MRFVAFYSYFPRLSHRAYCDSSDVHDNGKDDPQSFMNSIGNTPLIYLPSLSKETGCKIYAKAEMCNPSGSIKDRAAKYIIKNAEASGNLKEGDTIVEGTGGNTGIALSQIARSRGYNMIVVMPNCIGIEKIDYQKRLGAEVYLQPLVPFTNPENYARKAEIIAKERGYFFSNQFENISNFQSHFEESGPEIYRQTDGKIDAFVCAAGTGGTISGISAYLKSKKQSCKTYLIDPSGSVLFNYVTKGELISSGSSMIEGIGIGRITTNFSKAQLDDAIQGSDSEAVNMAYYLLKNEGLFIGPSAALNVVGAVKVARKMPAGSTVVTILCDSGERYVSKLYNAAWLEQEKLTPIEINSTCLDFVK